ncbi:hypothetical protein BH11CYA1_BH11CYA1_18300 [soil metagenome]
MDESYKLANNQHKRIYGRIERESFGDSRSVDSPLVIITGGQPGSGKSKLLEQSRELFPDGNVVVINGDDLRNFHPLAKEILKLDDAMFAVRTDPDSREWTRKLFDRAIETSHNIIFESTMREAGPISVTMQRLRERGYQLTAKVIATHERFSITGIFRRYEEQKAAKGYGRWSELSSHDAGYEGMPTTVDYIEKHGLVDRLEVYSRSGDLLYANDYVNGHWCKTAEALKAIRAERKRKPTESEKENFQSDWTRIFGLLDFRNAPLSDKERARSAFARLVSKLS